MIDWHSLLAHALGILGVALLLASFSYGRYQRTLAAQPAKTAGLYATRGGLMLLSLGMGLNSDSWPERALWGFMLIIALLLLSQSQAN